MTIFAVIITREATPGALNTILTTRFADNHLKVAPEVWLVAGRGPAKNVSDALGISDGSVGTGFVFAASGYFGRGPTNVWDWIKAKWEETSSRE